MADPDLALPPPHGWIGTADDWARGLGIAFVVLALATLAVSWGRLRRAGLTPGLKELLVLPLLVLPRGHRVLRLFVRHRALQDHRVLRLLPHHEAVSGRPPEPRQQHASRDPLQEQVHPAAPLLHLPHRLRDVRDAASQDGGPGPRRPQRHRPLLAAAEDRPSVPEPAVAWPATASPRSSSKSEGHPKEDLPKLFSGETSCIDCHGPAHPTVTQAGFAMTGKRAGAVPVAAVDGPRGARGPALVGALPPRRPLHPGALHVRGPAVAPPCRRSVRRPGLQGPPAGKAAVAMNGLRLALIPVALALVWVVVADQAHAQREAERGAGLLQRQRLPGVPREAGDGHGGHAPCPAGHEVRLLPRRPRGTPEVRDREGRAGADHLHQEAEAGRGERDVPHLPRQGTSGQLGRRRPRTARPVLRELPQRPRLPFDEGPAEDQPRLRDLLHLPHARSGRRGCGSRTTRCARVRSTARAATIRTTARSRR